MNRRNLLLGPIAAANVSSEDTTETKMYLWDGTKKIPVKWAIGWRSMPERLIGNCVSEAMGYLTEAIGPDDHLSDCAILVLPKE